MVIWIQGFPAKTRVLGWDEATQTTSYYPVSAVWSHDDLVISEQDINGEHLEVTPEHPFHTVNHWWREAKDLFAGAAR